MTVAIALFDQTNARERVPTMTLELASERITTRALIEGRVRREVDAFNRSKSELFRGLVQPTDTEKTLNGYRFRKPKRLDWREQADAAIAAFNAGQIYLLVDDRQVDVLDEEFSVTPASEVIFIKLMPLIGG